jgi:hypothetical protein
MMKTLVCRIVLCLTAVEVMEVGPSLADDEGGQETRARRRSNSQPSKDQTRASSSKQSPVEILDDDDEEEEDGDEEAYAVEKVLAHKIGKKTNVRAYLSFQ